MPETTTQSSARVRRIESRVRFSERVREILRYRELLTNLVRKDLKVRYKNSALGFVWSMLNPLTYLVVFYVVFSVFLGSGIPRFAIFLLSGLLAWNLFYAGMMGATQSMLANANLVSKVYFPREVLPLGAIGAALVHFFLQLGVLAAALLVMRHDFIGPELALVPAALATELVLLAAIGLSLSALNVYARDVQHIVELGSLGWFWMTPIIYPISLVLDKLGARTIAGLPMRGLYLANPLTPIVLAFQRALYAQDRVVRPDGKAGALVDAPIGWYWERLGYVAILAVVLLALSWRWFTHMEANLAEEL